MGVTIFNDKVIGGVMKIMLSMSVIMVDEVTSILDDRCVVIGVGGWFIS